MKNHLPRKLTYLSDFYDECAALAAAIFLLLHIMLNGPPENGARPSALSHDHLFIGLASTYQIHPFSPPLPTTTRNYITMRNFIHNVFRLRAPRMALLSYDGDSSLGVRGPPI